jgi:hypothetical protein
MNKATKTAIKEAKLRNLKRKYPTWTDEDYKSFTHYDKSDNNANGLTRCIIDFLTYEGCQAERINTMGRRIDKTEVTTDVLGRKRSIGSVEWQKGTGTKGSADISATIPMLVNGMKLGVSVKIEVKYGKDRQSEDQKKYEHSINSAGGIYYIARNMDEFYQWYLETFKK